MSERWVNTLSFSPKQPSECDPASTSYQQREYRFIRNHLIREEAMRMCPQQSRNKLSDQIFVNREMQPAQLLKFHPYQPHLAVMHKNCWRWVGLTLSLMYVLV